MSLMNGQIMRTMESGGKLSLPLGLTVPSRGAVARLEFLRGLR